jgi:hypothetical protein
MSCSVDTFPLTKISIDRLSIPAHLLPYESALYWSLRVRPDAGNQSLSLSLSLSLSFRLRPMAAHGSIVGLAVFGIPRKQFAEQYIGHVKPYTTHIKNFCTGEGYNHPGEANCF